MTPISHTRPRRSRRLALILLLVVAVPVVALLGVRLVTGRGLGLRSLPRAALSVAQSVAQRGQVASLNRGEYTNLIFLHHSTGDLLLQHGGLREGLAAAGYELWDQSYNQLGLRDPGGQPAGFNYFVFRDNTDPDGLAAIFAQPLYDLPVNTFSMLMQHEVIILKSCFLPGNHITSDEQLAELQRMYLGIRDRIDQFPDRFFILLTTPPVNPAETDPTAAARAMRLAGWLASAEFAAGHPNLAVFDLYSQLAELDPAAQDYGMLRADFRWGADSHPNEAAMQSAGPALVEFVTQSIQAYRTGRAN